MRRVLNKTKSGAKVADAVKQLEVEGGLAGKWKVLYEVSITAVSFLPILYVARINLIMLLFQVRSLNIPTT